MVEDEEEDGEGDEEVDVELLDDIYDCEDGDEVDFDGATSISEDEDDDGTYQPGSSDCGSEFCPSMGGDDSDDDRPQRQSATKKPQKPRDAPDPPPQPYRNASDACYYNGAVCGCTEDDHRLDPSLPASSEDHIDASCKIVENLGLKFHRYHRYLFCYCGSFIPLNKLLAHLKDKHLHVLPGSTKWSGGRNFPIALEHLAKTCGIPENQAAVEFDASEFKGPIARIKPAEERYRCLACQTLLRKDAKTPAVHWAGCRQKSPRDGREWKSAVSLEWCQVPFSVLYVGKARHHHYVPVDGPSRSPAPTPKEEPINRYSIPQGLDAFCPPWLSQLGWARWRDKQIERGLTTEKLVSFVSAPPRLSRRKNVFSQQPTVAEKIDWIGGIIQKRLIRMMKDANAYLNTTNFELRADLTAA
jgi:hypothetical protein